MTRTEFIENVQNWWELLDFCNDEGCDICDDVYDDDSKDQYINETLVDTARNVDDWRDLLQTLSDIPYGYDCYRLDGYCDFVGLDDEDFESYKDDVLEWGDDRDIWEDEEEEEEYVAEEPAPSEPVADKEEDAFDAESGCSIEDLFSASVSCLQMIEISAQEAKKQEDAAFEILFV